MKRLLLFITLVLLASTGWAQNNANVTVKQINEDAGQTATITRDDLFSSFSNLSDISSLQRLGAAANNVAYLQLVGDRNTASIIQAGSGLTGAINITGNDNTSSLMQNGSNLLSLININGNNNNLAVDQAGTGLGNLIQVEGAINNNLRVDQDQTGLQFTQGGNGSGMPLQITISGTNIPIKITNH